MRPAGLVLLAAALAAGCGTPARVSGPAPVPGTAAAQAPYDYPPAAPHEISIRLDLRAAREILAALSRARLDPQDLPRLESLPAVSAAIRDSGRPAEVFGRDFAAAFEEQTRISIFDFRRIREDRSRWQSLLATISQREAELTEKASRRAASLLPSDRTVSLALPIYLSFGLPGLSDHLEVPSTAEGQRAVVVDLSRALADTASSSASAQIDQLSRLVAGEAFRRAWSLYRGESPAWQRRDPSLGQLELLLYSVAEWGPPALYGVDENFFPLAVWLREPMRDSIDELNRIADRLVSSEADLDQRFGLAAEVRRPEFASKVAGPAGAFVSDGVIQTLGVDAFRAALAAGPRGLFEAYERAQQQRGKELIPLARAIQERLGAPAARS